MDHLAERPDTPALSDNAWRDDTLARFDVLATLSSALAPTWSVEREIDPEGDISIIVFPASDSPAGSAFVLYEENGFVQVATIRGESWQGRRAFPTCQSAVAAIVTAACRVLSSPAAVTDRSRASREHLHCLGKTRR